MKTKRCVLCDYQFEYDDKSNTSPFVKPHTDGAKYYYDLWHFHVGRCPMCGYACKDISHTFNKRVTHDEGYKNIANMTIIKELNNARPNSVQAYIEAGYYYDSIGDKLNAGKCLLQAGDNVYAELLYWDEYIFDSGDSVSSLMSKTQYDELKKFGDNLFNSALDRIEEYLKEEPDDIDATLLLAGSLLDGNKIQVIKATKILSNLKNKSMTTDQRLAFEFLQDDIR